MSPRQAALARYKTGLCQSGNHPRCRGFVAHATTSDTTGSLRTVDCVCACHAPPPPPPPPLPPVCASCGQTLPAVSR